MQTKTEQLIESGTYNNDNLFTVVLHKFMKHMTPPLDVILYLFIYFKLAIRNKYSCHLCVYIYIIQDDK